MPKADYAVFEALNPFFEIIQKGLSGLVDGDHYFDTIADDAFFEFRYHFPGWPLTIRGRTNLIAIPPPQPILFEQEVRRTLLIPRYRQTRFQPALPPAVH